MGFSDTLLIIICAYFMGFLAAIPVGATQLELMRRTINGFFSSAMLLIAGSVTSDTMYGVIAFWGLAPFLENKTVIAIFWLVNAVLLVIIGIWAIRESKKSLEEKAKTDKLLKKHHIAFVTGFSLAVTNPLMISWWLIGIQFLKHLSIISQQNSVINLIFLLSGAFGIASYLTVLAYGTYKAKRFISDRNIRRITLIFGISLILLAGYFLVQAGIVFRKIM